EQQSHLTAFLQGYAQRGVAADSLREEDIGGTDAIVSACARDPSATVWQKTEHNPGSAEPPSPSAPSVPDSATGSTTRNEAGSPTGNGNRTTGATTRDGVTRANPIQFTCGEFTRLPRGQQPDILFWLDGYNRKNDSAPQVDLDRSMAPYEDSCRAS